MMDNAKSGGFLCHLLDSGIMRIPEGGLAMEGAGPSVVPTSI